MLYNDDSNIFVNILDIFDSCIKNFRKLKDKTTVFYILNYENIYF